MITKLKKAKDVDVGEYFFSFVSSLSIYRVINKKILNNQQPPKTIHFTLKHIRLDYIYEIREDYNLSYLNPTIICDKDEEVTVVEFVELEFPRIL